MKNIYVDESGISAPEPVSIVCSVIIDEGEQSDSVRKQIEELFDKYVPKDQREGFVFHAMDLYGAKPGSLIRKTWSLENRVNLFLEFLSLPLKNDLAIAMGYVHRGMPLPAKITEVSGYQLDHIIALMNCMDSSDTYLTKYLRGEISGSVYAEDCRQMRSLLRIAGLMYRDNPLVMPKAFLRGSDSDYEYKIEKIEGDIKFLGKNDDSLLQIADACAFTFKRVLSANQSIKPIYLETMLGKVNADALYNDERYFSSFGQALHPPMKDREELRRTEETEAMHRYVLGLMGFTIVDDLH